MRKFGIAVAMCLGVAALAVCLSEEDRTVSTEESKVVSISGENIIRVACVGDSITYGMSVSEQDPSKAYPARLAAMLGGGFEVRNYGVSGTTALAQSVYPFRTTPEYRSALAYEADIVVLLLGTNDSDPVNWVSFGGFFEDDYLELLMSFAGGAKKPRLFVCSPPPLFVEMPEAGEEAILEVIIPAIKRVAEKAGAEFIDLYGPLSGKAHLLPDGVHPNAEGLHIIAKTVFAGLKE